MDGWMDGWMDAGRSADLVSQVPQHMQHRWENWPGHGDPRPKPTPAGAAESGGRGLIDDAQGTGPIFSGREWASRQREVAEPRDLMRVCNQPAPRTACSAVAPHAATH